MLFLFLGAYRHAVATRKMQIATPSVNAVLFGDNTILVTQPRTASVYRSALVYLYLAGQVAGREVVYSITKRANYSFHSCAL
jgi:hypothetical protein